MEGRQQSWPRKWLMTDERLGDHLWKAIGRLPSGAGIVVRHYSLEPRQRQILAGRVADAARDRGLTIAIAGDAELARRTGAALVHNPRGEAEGLPFSRAVHSLGEAESAKAAGAALVFVSPVHATRSHPQAVPLGPEQAIRIAKAAGVPAIALGGVNEQNFGALERGGFYGWAGIDAWLRVRT
jgi:thiamine-phosphate pyrophosphorylase